MTRVLRSIRLVGATGAVIRTAQFDGREHLVVPVVALMEAVIHPVNAPHPEFVPAELLARAPSGWNGRPLVVDHPFVGGVAVSANSPGILETMSFGMLFNTASPAKVLETKRLTAEAWIDLARAEKVGELAMSVVARAQNGEPIEVSVGALVTLNDKTGVFEGVEFVGEWEELVPDHLAMLPEGATGACSVAMGCGAPRAASAGGVRHQVTDSGLVIVGATASPSKEKAAMSRTLRQRLASLTSDVLSVVRFRGATPIATGESDTDLRRAIDAALRETEPGYLGIDDVFPADGLVVYACMPSDKFQLFQRAYAQGGDGLVTFSGERVEVQQVTRYEPIAAASAAAPEPEAQPAAAAATAAAPAVATTSADQAQPAATSGESASATQTGAVAAASSAQPAAAAPSSSAVQPSVTAAAAGSCQCQHSNRASSATGEAMHRNAERIRALIASAASHFADSDQAFLEALTDERLTQFETQAGIKPAAVAQPAAAAAQPTVAAAAQPVQLTEEQFMAMAPASIRGLVQAAQAADTAARVSLKRALVAAQSEYSEAEIDAMPTAQMERLARACSVASTAPLSAGPLDLSIRAAAINGTPAGQPSSVPVPDSYQLALEARRGRKDQ